jgi:hypothetical protein
MLAGHYRYAHVTSLRCDAIQVMLLVVVAAVQQNC